MSYILGPSPRFGKAPEDLSAQGAGKAFLTPLPPCFLPRGPAWLAPRSARYVGRVPLPFDAREIRHRAQRCNGRLAGGGGAGEAGDGEGLIGARTSRLSSRTAQSADPGPIYPGSDDRSLTAGIHGSRLSLRSAGMTAVHAAAATLRCGKSPPLPASPRGFRSRASAGSRARPCRRH